MTTQHRHRLTLATAVACLLVAAPAAPAAVPTDGADLVAAAVLEAGPGTPGLARFCFDLPVADPAPQAFSVTAYDVRRRWTSAAAFAGVAPDDDRCVLASFPDGAALEEGTVAAAAAGAVAEPGAFGQRSAPGAAPLAQPAAAAGATTGPDLVSATASSTAQAVTFCFDERLDDGAPVAGALAVVAAGGAAMAAVEASAASPRCVRARFPDPSDGVADEAQFGVRSGVRATAGAGAVHDAGAGASFATPSSAGAVGLTAGDTTRSGRTARPELLSAVRRTPTQWVLAFDQPVGGYVPARIAAVTDDAQRVLATSARRAGTQAEVLATFPAGIAARTDDLGEVVRVEVADGAVVDAEVAPAEKVGVTPGAVPVGRAAVAAGRTTGPDLLGARFEDGTNEVLARFDEPLGPVLLGGLGLLEASGTWRPAGAVALVDGPWLLTQHGVAADAATGLLVAAGAVADDGGGVAPAAAVAHGVALGTLPADGAGTVAPPPRGDGAGGGEVPGGGAPTPGGDGVSGGGTSGPGGPTGGAPAAAYVIPDRIPATAVPRAATSVTAAVRASRVRGRVRSAARACRGGRTVLVLAGRRIVGRATSRPDGTYAARLSRAVTRPAVRVGSTARCAASRPA